MIIDPDTLEVREVYQLMIGAILPRPIAWVGTQSQTGVDNLAPFSFFNGVTAYPPTLMFSASNTRDGVKKDTVRNIEETGEFAISVVTESQAEPMVKTAGNFEYGISEFEECKITKMQSQMIKPYGVLGAPVIFECKLDQIVVVGDGAFAANLIIGKIILINIADEVLTPNHSQSTSPTIDPKKIALIGRMGGSLYVKTNETFSMDR